MLGGEYDVPEFIGITKKQGGGSAGSLSSYSFPFLLFKAVACFLLQCVEPEQESDPLPMRATGTRQ